MGGSVGTREWWLAEWGCEVCVGLFCVSDHFICILYRHHWVNFDPMHSDNLPFVCFRGECETESEMWVLVVPACFCIVDMTCMCVSGGEWPGKGCCSWGAGKGFKTATWANWTHLQWQDEPTYCTTTAAGHCSVTGTTQSTRHYSKWAVINLYLNLKQWSFEISIK